MGPGKRRTRPHGFHVSEYATNRDLSAAEARVTFLDLFSCYGLTVLSRLLTAIHMVGLLALIPYSAQAQKSTARRLPPAESRRA